MRKRVQAPDPPEPELVPAPLGMRDIVWHDAWMEGFERPVKHSGKLARLKLAKFLGRSDFDFNVLMSMIKGAPFEAYRTMMLTQMRFELKSGPMPSWMEIATHYKRRIRTLEEEERCVVYEQAVYPGEEGFTPREKKKSKMEILDEKYKQLWRELERRST